MFEKKDKKSVVRIEKTTNRQPDLPPGFVSGNKESTKEPIYHIELIPIDWIKPYSKNAKKHPVEQVKKISNSIKEFGFTVPVIVDGKYNLIAGHGRYEASKKIGLVKIPGIKRDDLSEAQIRAYRIADNKIAESKWDGELLKMEIKGLQEESFDLSLLGFDEDEIDQILVDKESKIANIEELLNEIDINKAIANPDWFVIRAPFKMRNKIEKLLMELIDGETRVEKSYE